MSWYEDIATSLPPPDGDAETDLRRDILDELADHLDCAMRRELRRSDDETAARSAVLHRFGDPKRIAYRLWFDALKEKIMSQRISLVTNIVLAVLCVTMCAFVFISMRQNERVTTAMLDKIEALAAAQSSSPASAIWAEAMVNVRTGSPEGLPPEGCKTHLAGEMFNPGTRSSMDGPVDSEGNKEFGPIRPGKYALRVTASGITMRKSIVLYPGQNQVGPIIWPVVPEKPTEVSFKVTMPDSIKEYTSYLLCVIARSPQTFDTDEGEWSWNSDLVLIDPDGRAMLLDPHEPLFGETIGTSGGGLMPLIPERLSLSDRVVLNSAFNYRITSVSVLVKTTLPDSDRDYYLSSNAGVSNSGRRYRVPGEPLNDIDTEEWVKDLPWFEVIEGAQNVWHVELPEGLSTVVGYDISKMERWIGNRFPDR